MFIDDIVGAPFTNFSNNGELPQFLPINKKRETNETKKTSLNVQLNRDKSDRIVLVKYPPRASSVTVILVDPYTYL